MMTAWLAAAEGANDRTEGEPATPPLLLAAIRAARAGDHHAFEQVMLATERRVATLAWRILGDAEEVKEATQETFLRVYRHLGRFDEKRDFFAWLFRIAVNVCRDLERRRRRRRFFVSLDEAAPATLAPGLDEALVRGSEIALLTRAIDALPEKERLAVILREVEEMPTERVAELMGNTPATVRVQVSKARAKIRSWIEAHRKGGQR